MGEKLARSLGVFFSFPFEGARDSHGVYQRGRLLMEGLARASERVDLLFFVPADAPIGNDVVSRGQADLAAQMNGEVTVALCRRRAVARPRGTRRSQLARFLPGLLDFAQQDVFDSFCGPEQVAALNQQLTRRPEVVLAHDMRTMSPLLRAPGRLPPIVFDVDNIEHRVKFRHLLTNPGWPGERLRLGWLPAMILGELRAYRLACRVLLCSDADQQYLRRFLVRNTSVVPNAVDLPVPPLSTTSPPRLLFVGRLDYEPNARAAEWLVSRVWPRVAAAAPRESELWIAGTPPGAVRGSEAPPDRVRFLGFVENLRGLYQDVRVATAPILVGGGTRFKLIEAAAHSRAIVSTTIGAEGLVFQPESEILIRNSPEAFADACVGLLRDEAWAAALGRRAYARTEIDYSRAAVVETVVGEILTAASRGPAPSVK